MHLVMATFLLKQKLAVQKTAPAYREKSKQLFFLTFRNKVLQNQARNRPRSLLRSTAGCHRQILQQLNPCRIQLIVYFDCFFRVIVARCLGNALVASVVQSQPRTSNHANSFDRTNIKTRR